MCTDGAVLGEAIANTSAEFGTQQPLKRAASGSQG